MHQATEFEVRHYAHSQFHSHY